MSTIDERIVQMQFDNRQFESGVQTSIKSLDKLKKGLDLDKAADSLNNLDKAGKSFSIANISTGVDTISSKFSALGIVGITALQNITNSAINTGKRLLSSLTIDPVKTGLNEYETKMNAITTILTNTQSKGTTLDDVNKALGELNQYADLTIYNFAEMTRNIGTFTAAGVDLETSTNAIKGIANLAAGSGSTAQQASTAMYQLSQALAAGSLKLQDWNSVVNAGMGGELFQKALEKTAEELGNGRNMAVSFRESLQDGWITTEVLTKTLNKFAEDESLVKAATQVKTLTQLIDTMQESVQSGWAVSWEYIIGDREQAITALTAVSDGFNNIVGPSADARNEMLKFWNENGGRDAIISALANAFEGLMGIITPIKEAFREIFPPTTGEQLVSISNHIKSLTENFKIGEKTSNDIKNTFKGLFAILDIGKQAFVALSGGVGSLLGELSPLSGGLLSFTGSMGEYAVALDEAVKSSDFFNVAIAKINQVVSPIATNIRKAVTAITDAFKSFATIDTSGIDAFGDKIKVRFSPISALFEIVSDALTTLKSKIEIVAPGFAKLASTIGGAFGKLDNAIVEAFGNADFSKIFDMINSGLLAGILLGLKNFVGSMGDISDNAGDMLGGITGILDGVKGSLEAYQSSLKADTLIKIAVAMGILSASLVALSLVDSEKLTVALVAMSAMFVELFGSMAIFEKVMAGSGFRAMGKVTVAMMGLSVAILLLSSAMVKLSQLDYDGLTKGLVGIAGLSAILVTSAKALSTSSGPMMKGALGLITFAIAINVLVTAVEKLGALDTDGLTKGLIGVGVLAAELALFMNVAKFGKMGVSTGVGLIALSTAILILSKSVSSFAQLDSDDLMKGLAGVGIVLAELALFVNLTGNAKRVTTTAIGLTVLGAAMLIFSKAIGEMGSMSIETLAKGLIAMAGALAVVTVSMNLMPKNMISKATGMLGIASALVILSKALSSMGGMSWEEIAKGLITLAGSLTIIAVAMKLMTGALPGAAALLVISGALMVLSGVLKILGGMSIQEIGLSLLTLVGVFAVLGGAALILGPLTPVLLGLAGAVALLGIGVSAIGVGLLAFSAGLTALAVSGTAGAVALTAIVASIVGLIPMIAKALADGVIEFAKIIGESAPVLVEGIAKVLLALIKALDDVIPPLVTAIFKILQVILDTLVEYVPKIVDAGMEIIEGFLKGIADNIQDVVATAIDVVVNFIKGIAEKIGDVIQAGVELVLAFINGMADAISENTPLMIDAVKKLILAILGIGVEVIKEGLSSLKDAGSFIFNSGFVQGILSTAGNIGSAIKSLIDKCIEGIRNFFGGFKDMGKYVIDGFVEGINGKLSDALNAVRNFGSNIVDAAKDVLGIHSPSKVFKDEVGAQLGAGMAIGIKDSTKKAVDASKNMSKKSIEAAKAEFDEFKSFLSDKKYYNDLTLDEELYAWEEAKKRYAKYADQVKEIDKEIYRVKNAMEKEQLDNSKTFIADRKYYNELSLKEELAAWERIQQRYLEGTDERKEADKELYRIKQEMEEEQYNRSKEYIDEEKFYSRMALNDELEAWKRIQQRYAEGTEKRKEANRQVYSLEKEINEKNIAYTEQRAQINKDYNDQRISMEQEYADKVKSINDQLKSDIQSLENEYENSIKSRAKTLYNSFGLFDSVTVGEDVDGKTLITNLEDQVKAMNDWKDVMSSLEGKGLDEALLKEFEEMGPSATNNLKALNNLSEEELNAYVELWRSKHELSKNQATKELESLRLETNDKIAQLNADADSQLSEYRETWAANMEQLKTDTMNQITELETEWRTLIGYVLKQSTESNAGLVKDAGEAGKDSMVEQSKAMDEASTKPINSAKTIATEVKSKFVDTISSYRIIGQQIITGLMSGLNDMRDELMDMAEEIADSIRDTIQSALDIHSPSRVMMKLGHYTGEGFINGLSGYVDTTADVAQSIADSTINGFSSVISRIADVINSDVDLNPTIRPVLDLTDIKNGAGKLSSMLGQNGSISLDSSYGLVQSVASNLNSRAVTPPVEKIVEQETKEYTFNQYNYSPKALSRIDIYRQTRNQFSQLAKGVGTN